MSKQKQPVMSKQVLYKTKRTDWPKAASRGNEYKYENEDENILYVLLRIAPHIENSAREFMEKYPEQGADIFEVRRLLHKTIKNLEEK